MFSKTPDPSQGRPGPALIVIGLAAMLSVLPGGPGLRGDAGAAQAQAARFAVTGQAINPNLPAISATIVGRGLANGSMLVKGGGFEPSIYRTAFLATEDAADRVIAEPSSISAWDSLREGALDGADVDVWRIENGAFRLVRRDRIAEGGFHAGGWNDALPGSHIVPAGLDRAELTWEPWYRPDADTWFMLRALGTDGTLSQPSAAVRAKSPPEVVKRWAEKKEKPDGFIAYGGKREAGFGGPQAPRDLQATRDAKGRTWLTWRPAAGGPKPVGYALYRSAVAPERQEGYFLQLEGGADREPVRAGDLVMLRKEFRTVAHGDVATDRIWNAHGAKAQRPGPVNFWPDDTPGRSWALRPHAPDTPVTDPGETYLELRLGFGKTAELDGGIAGGVDGAWYQVLRPGQAYRVEAWLRSEQPGRAVFRFTGPGAYAKIMRPIIFETGPDWRKVSAEFTPPVALDKGLNTMQLEFTGPGVFSVDGFRIYRADAPYMALLPEDRARLAASGLSALRAQATTTTQMDTYDLAQLTAAGGIGGTQAGATLPQLLDIIAQTGADPWLTFEPHLTGEEWQGLVEYLAAPADAGPWAAKRARQGRAAPWTDAFRRIYIELGNETWNRIYSPWTFQSMTDAVTGERYFRGEVYGMFQEHVIAVLRASPWWKAARLEAKATFVIGGWNINAYGADAMRRSPGSSLLTNAPYIGGWDADQGLPSERPETYFGILNWVSQNSFPNARKHMEAAGDIARKRRAPVEVGTYEGGPGYVMNGLNGERVTREQAEIQERVMKSQAVGVAALDNFLAQAEAGYRLQNFYRYGGGARWNSHALWQNGGQDFPSWKLTALFNREGLGDMLNVKTLSTPSIDLPKAHRKEEVDDAPLTAVYATRKGDRLNVFVLSRRIPDYPVKGDDGCTPVEIALPFRSAAKVTLHRMAAPYDAENVTADNVKIETLDLAPPADPARFKMGEATGAPACGLPAAAAFLYVFEGVK